MAEHKWNDTHKPDAQVDVLAFGRAWAILGLFMFFMIAAGGAWVNWGGGDPTGPPTDSGQKRELLKVSSSRSIADQYDVIVVGTDPEGITAAVSAARNGLKTLLVDGRNRDVLGGLFTLGWLNTIDMNYAPEKTALVAGARDVLNKGLFSEWFAKIEGDSFDVVTAANAFYNMVEKEKNIDLLMQAASIKPLMGTPSAGGTTPITGITVTDSNGATRTIAAKAVIDATQDADIATLAGVPYTYGREDIGDKQSKMAVTLVFRIKNVTPDVWKSIKDRLNGDEDPNTGANEVSAWGYGGMYQYKEVDKGRVKMRGLNIGRQNDNSALINALQIFGIDGADPTSREQAVAIGRAELPHVVDYMKQLYPEFANIELDDTAPEPYVRETRHIIGEYRMSILDVLENRDQWDRIAFGSYPVDIQRTSPNDSGAVVCAPEQYAVAFRSLVPLKVDGLLVVGRAASYDTLPAGSARVVPVGMAEGQAAGAAAKLAIDRDMTFRQLSASKEAIAALQDTLNVQGMALKPFSAKPQPFMQHKEYAGLQTAVTLALAYGCYSNDFMLDTASNAQRFVNLTSGARRIKPAAFAGDPSAAVKGMTTPDKQPLTLTQAEYTLALAVGLKPSSPA
ncbi:MAG: hypothetical protein K0R75_3471, partial [Paenibacillaceae bacterium]|nr:hypothetical protein [Paenibacillaceae bacterium]